MKKTILTGAAATLLWTALAGAEPPTSTIRLNVGTLRNRSGVLGCRLYASASGFPESSEGTVERRLIVSGDVVRADFSDVGPGTYAISCMHDENANGRLDKSFLGIPTEGYGVSNNHTHALSAPSWDESKFVVERGKDTALAIALRY